MGDSWCLRRLRFETRQLLIALLYSHPTKSCHVAKRSLCWHQLSPVWMASQFTILFSSSLLLLIHQPLGCTFFTLPHKEHVSVTAIQKVNFLRQVGYLCVWTETMLVRLQLVAPIVSRGNVSWLHQALCLIDTRPPIRHDELSNYSPFIVICVSLSIL